MLYSVKVVFLWTSSSLMKAFCSPLLLLKIYKPYKSPRNNPHAIIIQNYFLFFKGLFGGENPKQTCLSSQMLCISFHIFSYMELPLTEYFTNILLPYFSLVHLRSSHMRLLSAYVSTFRCSSSSFHDVKWPVLQLCRRREHNYDEKCSILHS